MNTDIIHENNKRVERGYKGGDKIMLANNDAYKY